MKRGMRPRLFEWLILSLRPHVAPVAKICDGIQHIVRLTCMRGPEPGAQNQNGEADVRNRRDMGTQGQYEPFKKP
ncbi:MAG: hypothetical protein AAFY39_02205, partial [Pseudomonadota bacterium]